MPLAIDPGNKKSGWVSFYTDETQPGGIVLTNLGITPNETLLRAFSFRDTTIGDSLYDADYVLIETPAPRGMPTSAEEMDTLIVIGRIIDTCEAQQINWSMVFRGPVKLHLTGRTNSKDPNVRQALIDRFGGDATAIGGKKCPNCKGKGWTGREHAPCEAGVIDDGACWVSIPGPLWGVTSHAWAALAIACYWADVPQLSVNSVTHYFKARKAAK